MQRACDSDRATYELKSESKTEGGQREPRCISDRM